MKLMNEGRKGRRERGRGENRNRETQEQVEKEETAILTTVSARAPDHPGGRPRRGVGVDGVSLEVGSVLVSGDLSPRSSAASLPMSPLFLLLIEILPAASQCFLFRKAEVIYQVK